MVPLQSIVNVNSPNNFTRVSIARASEVFTSRLSPCAGPEGIPRTGVEAGGGPVLPLRRLGRGLRVAFFKLEIIAAAQWTGTDTRLFRGPGNASGTTGEIERNVTLFYASVNIKL